MQTVQLHVLDVRSSAMENEAKLPKFLGFRWHPPGKENQRWPLAIDVSPSTEKVILSRNSSKSQPKVTKNRDDKLPIRRLRSRAAKQPITPLQIDEAPYYTSTKSKGLHDFDVHSLCQPQIGEVYVFDSDVEGNLGQADDKDSDHDDSEDGDFREWQADGSEESDSFSLDEEDDLEAGNES
ncbi:hypothetical protein Cgig2_003699 [Carnegiea gigantea]|uniref:Transcription factor Iwr1 domain-containing protein n=1 Tax=Carnegiea gigantea TaxID=171969 RepID=A0A9Q1KFM0_9CARY|nr:hypothetical protein Cgig2_003699 [Carnegiea gigantea]